jgi:hypothetical protein
MIYATALPSLSEISRFISKIDSFPVSAGQLIAKARDQEASPAIVNFYKKFAPYRVFEDKEDLAASSEQVDILRSEENKMPKEEEVAAEDF